MTSGTKPEAARLTGLSWDDCGLLVDSVQDYAIFMLHPDGTIATWNQGAQRIKGYRPEEIIGRHFSAFYSSEDVRAKKPALALQTATTEGRVEDEGWRIRKDGSRFWANVIITALREPDGRLRGFAKVTRDLTGRREVEERLRASEERLRLLIEAVGDYAIYMLDAGGRVTTWNAGAERMNGYRADEILGRSFATFFAEADVEAGKPWQELETASLVGRFEDEEYRVRKDGTRFWANVVVTALRRDGELIGYAKVTRDLSARRQAEETERQLLREQVARATAQQNEQRLRESEESAKRAARAAEEAAERAEEANRVKEEFLATVSHELRTPLNAIVGWSALLRTPGHESAIQKGLDAIHRNAMAQAKIVDDILDVSRIITGKLRLDPKPTSLVAIVKDAIDVLQPSANAKEIAIELTTYSDRATVVADPERFRQVVWNLLSNAVKFTERGGRVDVRIGLEGSNVTLSVQDTGVGIDPEFLPYVFDRFKQADSSTTRGFGGLGLGLAIVRHIVELHGGEVYAESAGKGLGSTFRVELPTRSTALSAGRTDTPVDGVPLAAVSPKRELDGVRILIVDDDLDARELVEAVLSTAGAEVRAVESAQEAVEAFLRERPDVLVSDIGMPGEDGYALLRRIQSIDEEAKAVPSIALTAYTRAEDRAKALAAGFALHVPKPIDPNQFVTSVADLARGGATQ